MESYGVEEVMILFDVSRSKAYRIIRDLSGKIESEGGMCPKSERIQKDYFCKNYILEPEECDEILALHMQSGLIGGREYIND